MTLSDFAQSVINDPVYREGIVKRAAAGDLPVEIEMLILELADARSQQSADRSGREPLQSKTWALVRASAPSEEVQS